MRFPMAKEGIPFLAAPLGMLAILTLFSQMRFGVLWWLCIVLAVCVAGFFRDPEREIPPGDRLIICPADGKIVKIEETPYPALGPDTYLQVSIFMSVFNAHINRAPISGKVEQVIYNPGKFMAAFEDKASLLNEQNSVILSQTVNGKTTKILVKQIAGLIARRIVCYAKPGMNVERGQRFGLIRFGSRVDVLLPKDAELRVKLGETVRGGTTVIGTLP